MLEQRAARTQYVGFRATKQEAKAIARYARQINLSVTDIMRILWKQLITGKVKL